MPALAEAKSLEFWKTVRTEFLATTLLVVFGCGSVISWKSPGGSSDVTVALTFGFCYATLVQCCGHVSGAHLNPAVTLAMLVTGNVTVLRCACYVTVQLLGGVCGAGVLYGLTPGEWYGELGVARVAEGVSVVQAFGVEFMATFLYVFSVFANIDKPDNSFTTPLHIGLSVTVSNLFALKYTGAGLNPARCLGPALVTNVLENQWVYWVGPVVGAIMAAFTYEYTETPSSGFRGIRRSFKRKYDISTLLQQASMHGADNAPPSVTATELTLDATNPSAANATI